MLTRYLLATALCIPLLLRGMTGPSDYPEHQKKQLLLLEKLSAQMRELSASFTGPAKQFIPALTDDELIVAIKAAIKAKTTIPRALKDRSPLGPILSHMLEIYGAESLEPLGVYPHFLAEKFLLLSSLIKTVTELYTTSEVPAIVSHASGYLLLEYLLVSVLNKLGYKKIVLHTIDTLYESPRTTKMRRRISVRTLQNKFTLDTFSLAFQSQNIKNLFRAFIDKLNAKNIIVKHCFAPWVNQEQPELHWGIWNRGADFIWATKAYKADYPQPLIFMIIQPSIPPYFYALRPGFKKDFQDFLSFKILAQKPCINDIHCIKNTSGCKKATASWQIVVPSSTWSPLLILSHDDPTLVTQMNNLFTKISRHENITKSIQALLQCRSYGEPAENPDITFYDMVTLTAADDRARAFYASLDKQGKYRQRISSPPESTLQFAQAIRTGQGVWYAWDHRQQQFNRLEFPIHE